MHRHLKLQNAISLNKPIHLRILRHICKNDLHFIHILALTSAHLRGVRMAGAIGGLVPQWLHDGPQLTIL